MDNQIHKSEEIIAKLAEFERKLDVIEKHINDKASEIKTLIDRVYEVENKMIEKVDCLAESLKFMERNSIYLFCA